MVKKGDTLIEVMLAVGIFSMIAIAITSVMSSGTSGAQTALETTLAREEIDTQAEALRFIQSSYVADKDSSNKKFTELWQKITDSAIVINETDQVGAEKILQFMPENCSELYNSSTESNIFSQRAFIINPRALGTFSNVDSVFISTRNDSQKNIFQPASIYPRLIYGNSSQNDSSQEITSSALYDQLYMAEGIYVVAVRDKDTTNIFAESEQKRTAAFYDFYIRTCWYGSNAKTPSTISTVIRLYDPKAIKSEEE